MRQIPFDFVIERLDRIHPHTKPMFGCTAIYVEEKIVFILRNKEDAYVHDNGVWVATTPEHHVSLKKEFPSMRSISIFGPKQTAWQNLPADSEDFENAVERACELVVAGDPRIGKIPKRSLPRKAKSKKRKIRARK